MITAPSTIEDGLFARGVYPIAGVDEVGRGPLAGPVMACAIIMPPGLIIEGVNDSKKVPEKRRILLAEEIKKAAISYSFGIAWPAEIDRINILQGAMQAMAQAVKSLGIAPEIALVDGISPPPCDCRVMCVKKGDTSSRLIAAASILAKVERDNIMQNLHAEYPLYGWDKNKGYGTKAHMEALRIHGLSPMHRKSFCKGVALNETHGF